MALLDTSVDRSVMAPMEDEKGLLSPVDISRVLHQRRKFQVLALVAMTVLAAVRFLLLGSSVFSASSVKVPDSFGETFQVHRPVRTDAYNCSVILMQHTFATSWGVPFVGFVNRPACGEDFSAVILQLTVVGQRRQFDRLGFVFLDDVEIWRTSTLEPTINGSYSITSKDVTRYASLFTRKRKIIVDIGNTVDSTYVSPFNVTLEIFYQYSEFNKTNTKIADLVLPLSSLSSRVNLSSAFSLPGLADTAVSVPQNTEKAIVEIYASGNADEEFWYTNVPNKYRTMFPNVELLGGGSFREVQLLVDGKLAGVVWPFAVIYTGGLSPGLWRPIVAIDAFDQMTYTIDISPFLGLLCDGRHHIISFKVVGTDAAIMKNWYVSGNLQIWRRNSSARTTGHIVDYIVPDTKFMIDFQNHSTVPRILTTASRSMQIVSKLSFEGQQTPMYINWTQELSFRNDLSIIGQGLGSRLIQSTSGVNIISSTQTTNSVQLKPDNKEFQYSYPLSLNSSLAIGLNGAFAIAAAIDHGKTISSDIVSDPYSERTRQVGASFYSRPSAKGNATSFGQTIQDYMFDAPGILHYRSTVRAKNGVLKESRVPDSLSDVSFADGPRTEVIVDSTYPLPSNYDLSAASALEGISRLVLGRRLLHLNNT